MVLVAVDVVPVKLNQAEHIINQMKDRERERNTEDDVEMESSFRDFVKRMEMFKNFLVLVFFGSISSSGIRVQHHFAIVVNSTMILKLQTFSSSCCTFNERKRK